MISKTPVGPIPFLIKTFRENDAWLASATLPEHSMIMYWSIGVTAAKAKQPPSSVKDPSRTRGRSMVNFWRRFSSLSPAALLYPPTSPRTTSAANVLGPVPVRLSGPKLSPVRNSSTLYPSCYPSSRSFILTYSDSGAGQAVQSRARANAFKHV